jgi:hypothetical protein
VVIKKKNKTKSMLKFLRKIRKKLLDEGKLKSYLIYAIGEILLVVIGILLALQVNNWNENRKLKKTEQTVLRGLNSDLERNKKLIKEGKKKHQYEKEIGEAWIKMMNADTSNVKLNKHIESLLFWGPTYTTIDLVDGSLNNLINGGKLDIIKNEDLKRNLIDYPMYIEKYKDKEIEIRRIVIEKIRQRAEVYISLRQLYDGANSFQSDFSGLLRDRQLCNDYIHKDWTLDELFVELNNLENFTDSLIFKIGNENQLRFE